MTATKTSRRRGQRTEDPVTLNTGVATAWYKAWLPWGSQRSAADSDDANSTQDGSDGAHEASSMGSTDLCRICFRGSRAGILLSPCNCRGSIGLVHKECLEEWLSRRNTEECSVCSYQFKVEHTPKSYLDWLRDPSSKAKTWLVETSLCGILAVLLLAVSSFSAVSTISCLSVPPICVVIGIILSLSGPASLALLFVTQRHHQREFTRWREKNWGVHLLLLNNVLEGTASEDRMDPPPGPPLPSDSTASVPPSLNHTAAGDNTAVAMTTTTAVAQEDFQVMYHPSE